MGSEPTVWDGDMTISSKSFRTRWSSEPTVWDGDTEVGKTPLYHVQGSGSEPTVWDGDWMWSPMEKPLSGGF